MGVLGIGTVIGSLLNYNTQALNRQQQERWNQKFYDLQLSENQWQHNFANKQFKEQQFLNRNQVQLTASDMQKAGINPAMASGGANLTSGSYSSNSSVQQANPYLVEDNALSHILDGYMREEELKLQEKIAKQNNDTQKEIARINAQASNYSADKSSESSKYSADRSYDATKYATDKQVAEIKRHNAKTENATREQIQQKQQQIWEEFELKREQVQQAWTALQNAKKDSDRKFKLQAYQSALNTLKTISSEAREWYDSLSYQNMFQKQVDSLDFDLPF